MGAQTEGLSLMDAAEQSILAVEHLIKDLGLPKHFKELGMKEEDIPLLANNAVSTGIHESTPRQVNLEDVVDLFRQAF